LTDTSRSSIQDLKLKVTYLPFLNESSSAGTNVEVEQPKATEDPALSEATGGSVYHPTRELVGILNFGMLIME
jgi:hypothetical protein